MAGIATAATAATVALAGTGTPAAQSPTPPSGPPPLELPLTSLVPDATVAVGGARHLAASDDAVWVLDREAGVITRVDATTNAKGSPVTVGTSPCADPLVAFKSVWVAVCGGPALARLDLEAAKPAELLTATIRGVGAMASGAGSVWIIADAAGALLRVDPDTNRAVADLPVPGGAQALAFANDALWVAGTTTPTVTRINGHTNVAQKPITVGTGPLALAAGEGGLWVLNTGDATVSRIDPTTGKVVTTIRMGVATAGGVIAAGEGSVWVSAPGAPLVRIDPATNAVTHTFSGPGGGAIAIGAKSLWIAATPTDIWRVDPRRVEATRTATRVVSAF